jgi:carbamoyl-phosphate synthase large subunit
MQLGLDDGDLHRITGIDPWFLAQIREIVDFETSLRGYALPS